MPRNICIGAERKLYEDACTNVMPMSFDPNLLVSLSLPMLLNLKAGVQQAAAMKGTAKEKEAYYGVSPDGKTIIREIKPSFDKHEWETSNLASYILMVPKAQTKPPPHDIPSSLTDVMKHNEAVWEQRRAFAVAGSASAVPTYSITNDALTEIKSVMSSIVTSSTVLNSPLESTETTKLTDSETLS